MPRKVALTYLALLLLAVGVGAAGLRFGQVSLDDPALKATLLELRASRIAAAFLAGAALAMGGCVAQGVFRNPLVSPDILGSSAGAMLGGQVALLGPVLLGQPTALSTLPPEMALPLGCLAGAAVALGIVLLFARERTTTLTVILTGFILSSLFLSLGGFVISMAQDSWDLGRAVVAFTLGGVGGVGRRQLLAAAPLVMGGGIAVWFWGRTLDILLSGEEEATALGVNAGQARRWCIVWVAALTAAAVSVGGTVGFVGLIVPHVLRPLVGVLHRRLLPAAALAGGTFLVACDLLARVLPTQTEVPLGVITGLIGAPVFLVMVARAAREWAHG